MACKEALPYSIATTYHFRFLWVALQIDDLCRQTCDADIRKSIATLPKDLPKTYQRIMSQIIQNGQAEIVNKIFRWVAAAKRPLLLDELREAIAIQLGDKFLERDRLVNNIGGLISWCGNLVTLDDEDLLVQFVHYTVKEFLLSEDYATATGPFHFRLADIDHAAGEACVTYLGFNDFNRQIIKAPKTYQPVQLEDLVASTFAGSQSHLALYGIKLAKRFYKNPKVDFDVIKQLDYISGKDGLFYLDKLQTQYSFLHYACEYWLSHTSGFTRYNTSLWNLWKQLVLTEHPLAPKPWTIAEDRLTRRTIAEYILDRNHAALLACFLESGTQVQLYIDQGYLLVKASGRGMTQLVESIIDYNKYRAIDGNKALQVAAGGGYLDLVERLLAAKADVNAAPAGGNGRRALQAAAGGGHLEVMERLLAANADVNAAPGQYYGRTALQAAAEGGHVEVVERLLAANADVNAAPAENHGRTALQAAAGGGHLDVVKRLLAAKADVNAAPSYYGRTALQAAAGGGHVKVVERLLAVKADVNAAPARDSGRTALQAAVEGGHVEVAERLLAAKADVNAAPAKDFGRTALQAAAGGGHVEVVERLLAVKAGVNAAPAKHFGCTALQAAAGGGHLEVVERLLAANAEVNAAPAKDGGCTALQAAAEGGHVVVVERLRIAGARY
jgi:ankyrin repeat protein